MVDVLTESSIKLYGGAVRIPRWEDMSIERVKGGYLVTDGYIRTTTWYRPGDHNFANAEAEYKRRETK